MISVAAIIDGLNGYIQNRIKSFGSRSFFITRIPPGFTGLGRLPAKIRTRKYLEISDAQYLKENVPGLDVSTAFAQRINLGPAGGFDLATATSMSRRMILRGTEPDYAAALPLFTVATGRFISAFDEEHARPVVVIGNAIADHCFRTRTRSGKRCG